LNEWFSGGVRVEWLNDTSAFVAVNRKEKAEEGGGILHFCYLTPNFITTINARNTISIPFFGFIGKNVV